MAAPGDPFLPTLWCVWGKTSHRTLASTARLCVSHTRAIVSCPGALSGQDCVLHSCPQPLVYDWKITVSARCLLNETLITWLLFDWRMDSKVFPKRFWRQTSGCSVHSTSFLSGHLLLTAWSAASPPHQHPPVPQGSYSAISPGSPTVSRFLGLHPLNLHLLWVFLVPVY